MKAVIAFDIDNAAFEHESGDESMRSRLAVADALKALAARIERNGSITEDSQFPVIDANGNTVGGMFVEESD